MKDLKNRELVKPQKIQNEELVEGFCQSGYSSGSTSCGSGYSYTNPWWGSTTTESDSNDADEVLF